MENPQVAIQGIAASFHAVAAREYFGDDAELLECTSFKEVCDQLKNDDADYCVMAIENTIAGSLLPNYNLLEEYHFRIIGELYLPIHMHLMVLPGVKEDDIRFIQSHPIALQQCTEFLWDFHRVEIIETADTAAAARDIRDNEKRDTAAIANQQAAETYGLEILERMIETNHRNYTRFLVLSKYLLQSEEHNKASITVELDDHPGSLADVLDIFRDNNLNITKIQSVPMLSRKFEFKFHIDLEWENKDDYEKAIPAILKNSTGLHILGEYKRGTIEQEDTRTVIAN